MENSEIQVSKESSSNNFDAVKSKMTIEATNIIAATFIAKRNFPHTDSLPKFSPLPFNNFGHFLLFDNSLFLHIIYQTVEEIKEIVKLRKNKYQPWLWGAGVLIIFSVFLYIGYPEEIGVQVLSLVAGIAAYFISINSLEENINKKIADFKAEVIQKLLDNKWEENKNVVLPKRLVKVFSAATNGCIPNNETAVLIRADDLNEEQPFPGFGMLQLQDKFHCSPKKLDLTIKKEEDAIFNDIVLKLQSTLLCCGLNNISLRKVIVINSDSLSINSPWLNEEKAPVLSKEIGQNDIYSFDENASLRAYILIEALFPKYDSAACFFIQPFKAENSAGWHIAVSTIGPPELRQKYLKDKLQKYSLDKSNTQTDTFPVTVSDNTSERYLTKIKEKQQLMGKFHNRISILTLNNLDILEEKSFDESGFEKRVKKIIENEICWPGKYYYDKYNIREINSLTFGGDFFGTPELISSIQVIYDQVSRKILESIEEQGFDISKYKDKDGKFSINAENIDKIIVGEVINMKPEKKKAQEETANTTPNK